VTSSERPGSRWLKNCERPCYRNSQTGPAFPMITAGSAAPHSFRPDLTATQPPGPQGTAQSKARGTTRRASCPHLLVRLRHSALDHTLDQVAVSLVGHQPRHSSSWRVVVVARRYHGPVFTGVPGNNQSNRSPRRRTKVPTTSGICQNGRVALPGALLAWGGSPPH
jgi:hypothetical protein